MHPYCSVAIKQRVGRLEQCEASAITRCAQDQLQEQHFMSDHATHEKSQSRSDVSCSGPSSFRDCRSDCLFSLCAAHILGSDLHARIRHNIGRPNETQRFNYWCMLVQAMCFWQARPAPNGVEGLVPSPKSHPCQWTDHPLTLVSRYLSSSEKRA